MSTKDKKAQDDQSQDRPSTTAEPEVSDSGLDRDRGGIIGAVDSAPRDSDEATSSDPVTSTPAGAKKRARAARPASRRTIRTMVRPASGRIATVRRSSVELTEIREPPPHSLRRSY